MADRRPVVYVLRPEGANEVKIGFSSNLKQRALELQAACPLPLFVEDARYRGKDYENRMHQLYTDVRIWGEWFEIPEGATILDGSKAYHEITTANYALTIFRKFVKRGSDF